MTVFRCRRRPSNNNSSSSAIPFFFLLFVVMTARIMLATTLQSLQILSVQTTSSMSDDDEPILPAASSTTTTITTTTSSNDSVHLLTKHNQNRNQNQNNQTVLFFVHIGPPKTGTTTLQAYMTQYQHDLWQQDRIRYLGKYIHPSSKKHKKDNPDNPVQEMLQFVKCLTKQEQKQQQQKQQRMMQTNATVNNADETTIDISATANPCGNFSSILASMEENVINNNAANSATTTIQPNAYFISEEHLAFSRSLIHYPRVLQRLQQAVRTPQPQPQLQLHVVITYRRPLHWLPSARKQVNLRSQKYNRWKGEIPPLFPTALQNLELDGGAGRHQYYPTPWELRRIVEQYDIPYSIYNVHHDDDNNNNNNTQQQQTSMLETWMCDILSAHNLCQQLLQQRKNNNNNNHSSSSTQQQEQEKKLNALPQRNTDLLYDEIVSAARARGLLLLGAHIQRKQAIQAAQEFWEQQPQPPQPQNLHLNSNNNNKNRTMTTDDLPMKCPSPNEMERFWNVSWQLELEMVPSSSSLSREEYQKPLLLLQQQRKLCSVDIAAVLQDAKWQSFFATMQ
jgi:hypothetical protein